jgi:hypothetical protein
MTKSQYQMMDALGAVIDLKLYKIGPNPSFDIWALTFDIYPKIGAMANLTSPIDNMQSPCIWLT